MNIASTRCINQIDHGGGQSVVNSEEHAVIDVSEGE
jgi:hypothetical protein